MLAGLRLAGPARGQLAVPLGERRGLARGAAARAFRRDDGAAVGTAGRGGHPRLSASTVHTILRYSYQSGSIAAWIAAATEERL